MPFGARLATTSLGIKKLAEAKQVLLFLEFSVFFEQTKYEFNIFICLYSFHDSW
jgi:hypothetical protein